MAGTLISFENKKEEFTLKLNEVQASFLYDFISKFERLVDKDKTKKAFDYNTEDYDYIIDCVFKDVKEQLVDQADKALTEDGLDLNNSKEALQALKNVLDDLLRVSKEL